MNIPVLTPDQSAAWDRRAEAAGIDTATLMETAGRSAAQVLAARFPEQLRQGVLVATGLGNNGGDGWVLARALHRLEVPVWVAPLAGEGSRLQHQMAERAQAEGVRVVTPDGPWPGAAILVDAILGTGARGAPRAAAAAMVERLNDLALPIVALDGPTGVDLLNGASHGTAIHAVLSITFGGFRRGHLLARDEVGDVVVVDIGLPSPDPAWPTLFTDLDASERLPALGARAHKGDRGRVVVIGGDAGMTGAVRLAARAAFGAGAGLVHAVAPAATVQALVVAEPDLQTLAQSFDAPLAEALVTLLGRADSVVLGPGLGRSPGRCDLVHAVLGRARRAVVDADGLIALAADHREWQTVRTHPFVLTPHLGEFRALFPGLADGAELNPWEAASAAATACGATVLLKGVPTVVASPARAPTTIAAGNPGLATGGSGDLLSGFIGALLAQEIDPHLAACLGAQILGRAADSAARRTTARGMRPMDVLAALPDLWRTWQVLGQARPTVRPPVVFELEKPILV